MWARWITATALVMLFACQCSAKTSRAFHGSEDDTSVEKSTVSASDTSLAGIKVFFLFALHSQFFVMYLIRSGRLVAGEWTNVLQVFASGVALMCAFCSVLPHASEVLAKEYEEKLRVGTTLLVTGFSLLIFLRRVVLNEGARGDGAERVVQTWENLHKSLEASSASNVVSQRLTGFLALMALSAHIILDAVALGAADKNGTAVALGVSVLLLRCAEISAIHVEFAKRDAGSDQLLVPSLFAMLSPLSMAVGWAAGASSPRASAVVGALACGSMAFMAVSEHIVHNFPEGSGRQVGKFGTLVLGLGLGYLGIAYGQP